MRFLLYLLVFLPGLIRAQATFDSLKLIDSRIVYFDFGKADLRPEVDSTLREITTTFTAQPELTVHLTAHTDSIGNEQSNLQLSNRRAEAVRNALLTRGLPQASLIMETFGERIPVANNEDEKGRQLNRRVTIDLYRANRMRFLEGQIRDLVTGEGIPADLIFHGKSFRDSLSTDSAGRFRHPVPDNQVIAAEAYAKDYFFDTKMLKVTGGVSLDIRLRPAQTGEAVDIQNLYFVGNQAVLLNQSEPELPKVLRFMQLNPQLKIEIAGHINQPNRPPVTRDSWDWQLSVARAKLVYDYLLENSIDSSRVSYKGYGNTQMRFPRAHTEREQALNRRVEIRVLENDQ